MNPASTTSKNSFPADKRVNQSPRTRLRNVVAWISTPDVNPRSHRVYGVRNKSLNTRAKDGRLPADENDLVFEITVRPFQGRVITQRGDRSTGAVISNPSLSHPF